MVTSADRRYAKRRHLRVVNEPVRPQPATDSEVIREVARLASTEFQVLEHDWLELGRDPSTVGARYFVLAFLRLVLMWEGARVTTATGFIGPTIERAVQRVEGTPRFLKFCFTCGHDAELLAVLRRGG